MGKREALEEASPLHVVRMDHLHSHDALTGTDQPILQITSTDAVLVVDELQRSTHRDSEQREEGGST